MTNEIKKLIKTYPEDTISINDGDTMIKIWDLDLVPYYSPIPTEYKTGYYVVVIHNDIEDEFEIADTESLQGWINCYLYKYLYR